MRADSLVWTARNRDYSVACNGLVNKLAQIQLEIPHIVYSAPNEVNYLADLFSQSFRESRFLDTSNDMPPLNNPSVLTESELHFYFSTPVPPKDMDVNSHFKIVAQKSVKSVFETFNQLTPEQKYYSAIRLLHNWNDEKIMSTGGIERNILEIIQLKNPKLYETLITKLIDIAMSKLFDNLDNEADHIRNTVNLKKIKDLEILNYLKEEFLKTEALYESMKECVPGSPEICIKYSLSACATHLPQLSKHEIKIPIQAIVILQPAERQIIDTMLQLFIPSTHSYHLRACIDNSSLEVSVCPSALCNNFSRTLKLSVKNIGTRYRTIKEGTFLTSIYFTPILNPLLFPLSSIESLTSSDCLEKESLKNLSSPDLPEITELIQIEPSFLHEVISDLIQTEFHISEINVSVLLPSNLSENKAIIRNIKKVEYDLILSCRTQKALPHIENFSYKLFEDCLDELTHELVRKNHCLTVEQINEQGTFKHYIQVSQISDNYLNLIYESLITNKIRFPTYHLTMGILYKRRFDRKLKNHKSVLALPDILLLSVIHSLHTALNHPNFTTTLKNFERYYYNRLARKYIKNYIQSCPTCVHYLKIDVQNILKPTDLRSCAHIDPLLSPESQFPFNNCGNKSIVEKLKKQSYLNKEKIPQFFLGQPVQLKTDIVQGSCSIRPLIIKNISQNHAFLLDSKGLEIKEDLNSLKCLSLKEFRLLLSKGWNMHQYNLHSSHLLSLPAELRKKKEVNVAHNSHKIPSSKFPFLNIPEELKERTRVKLAPKSHRDPSSTSLDNNVDEIPHIDPGFSPRIKPDSKIPSSKLPFFNIPEKLKEITRVKLAQNSHSSTFPDDNVDKIPHIDPWFSPRTKTDCFVENLPFDPGGKISPVLQKCPSSKSTTLVTLHETHTPSSLNSLKPRKKSGFKSLFKKVFYP